jgi:NADH-quinone oxidoreductase subunit M
LGVYQQTPYIALLLGSGLVLGAAYGLWLYRQVIFGEATHESVRGLSDITVREKLVFAPLIVLTILLGIYTKPIIEPMQPAVERLINRYQAALANPLQPLDKPQQAMQ